VVSGTQPLILNMKPKALFESEAKQPWAEHDGFRLHLSTHGRSRLQKNRPSTSSHFHAMANLLPDRLSIKPPIITNSIRNFDPQTIAADAVSTSILTGRGEVNHSRIM